MHSRRFHYSADIGALICSVCGLHYNCSQQSGLPDVPFNVNPLFCTCNYIKIVELIQRDSIFLLT